MGKSKKVQGEKGEELQEGHLKRWPMQNMEWNIWKMWTQKTHSRPE